LVFFKIENLLKRKNCDSIYKIKLNKAKEIFINMNQKFNPETDVLSLEYTNSLDSMLDILMELYKDFSKRYEF